MVPVISDFMGCQVISYKDHFEQRPLRTRETISYKGMGVTSNKDFLYEVVPEYIFYIHTEESVSYKDQFVQRRPYKNPIRVNFVFEFLDWVRFFLIPT